MEKLEQLKTSFQQSVDNGGNYYTWPSQFWKRRLSKGQKGCNYACFFSMQMPEWMTGCLCTVHGQQWLYAVPISWCVSLGPRWWPGENRFNSNHSSCSTIYAWWPTHYTSQWRYIVYEERLTTLSWLSDFLLAVYNFKSSRVQLHLWFSSLQHR